jgi:hypothetical protein
MISMATVRVEKARKKIESTSTQWISIAGCVACVLAFVAIAL